MQRTIARGLVAGVLVVLVLAAGPVAAENGFYIGGSFGQTSLKINDLELDPGSFDYKADTTSYKIIVGYRLMGFFAVEGNYVDFGSLKDSSTVGGEPVSLETDLSGFDICAMGMLPIGIVDVFAKAGLVSWDANIQHAIGAIIDVGSDSGTDMVFGLGAQVRFKGLAVRGEIEYFDIADASSVYLISLGATYTF